METNRKTSQRFSWEKVDSSFKDLPEKTLQKIANSLIPILTLQKTEDFELNHTYLDSFFTFGFVELLGYQFTVEDPIHVLYCGEDFEGNTVWYEQFVPSDDPEIVKTYIRTFVGNDVPYFILDDKSINRS